MYYMLNNYIFIRCFNCYTHLTDKLFNRELIGDKNLFLFLKHLTYSPLKIEEILSKIYEEFSFDSNKEQIAHDAENIFDNLSSNKFLASGKTEEECLKNKTRFSYSTNQKNTTMETTEYNFEKIEEFRKVHGDTPPLIRVLLEITKECNERCIHCYIPHQNKNIKMSKTKFYDFIDQCSTLGTVVEIRISGGECMSHPHFKDFIKCVKSKNLYLSILTNLTLLDDETIDILKDGLLSEVQVTLFSMDSNIHDKITKVPGSLKKTLANLEKLHEANIPVSIATQVLELNKDSTSEIFDYATEHGFTMLYDYTIMAREDLSTDNLNIAPKDLSCFRKLCKMRIEKSNDYKLFLSKNLQAPLKSVDSHLCNACMDGIQIGTNLKVHPCPGWDIELGDLNTQSIKEVWTESQLLRDIRKKTLADFKKCSTCDTRNFCHICMSQAYAENGSIENFCMPERICDIYKTIKNTAEEIFNNK